jgi:riboflavin kinase/FMN adenylyltransferase
MSPTTPACEQWGSSPYPCPMSVVLSIGNFDGVHRGHQALIRRARELAGQHGRVVALAFDPHPLTFLRPEIAPPVLTTFEQKAALLRACGADDVERLQPTPELLALSPEDFLRLLVERFGPSFVVEGPDFRFGKDRAGDNRTLRSLGDALGFQCEIVPTVEIALADHLMARVSSTLVRWLIVHGRVRDATEALARPYEVTGTVVAGDRRGRFLGIPTANIETALLLPGDGVYAGAAIVPGGSELPAAINIGSRPTFNGRSRRLEVHLIGVRSDSCGSLLPGLPEYGWPIRVRFIAYLRDDVRFADAESLVAQMNRDISRVQACIRACS